MCPYALADLSRLHKAASARTMRSSLHRSVWASARIARSFQYSTPWFRSSRVTLPLAGAVAAVVAAAGVARLLPDLLSLDRSQRLR